MPPLSELMGWMILADLIMNAAQQAFARRQGLSFEQLQAIFDRRNTLNAEWAERMRAHAGDDGG